MRDRGSRVAVPITKRAYEEGMATWASCPPSRASPWGFLGLSRPEYDAIRRGVADFHPGPAPDFPARDHFGKVYHGRPGKRGPKPKPPPDPPDPSDPPMPPG